MAAPAGRRRNGRARRLQKAHPFRRQCLRFRRIPPAVEVKPCFAALGPQKDFRQVELDSAAERRRDQPRRWRRAAIAPNLPFAPPRTPTGDIHFVADQPTPAKTPGFLGTMPDPVAMVFIEHGRKKFGNPQDHAEDAARREARHVRQSPRDFACCPGPPRRIDESARRAGKSVDLPQRTPPPKKSCRKTACLKFLSANLMVVKDGSRIPAQLSAIDFGRIVWIAAPCCWGHAPSRWL